MVFLLQVSLQSGATSAVLTIHSGTWSTYLGTYFTVRARALSSLVSPFFCIVGCFALGFVLDMKNLRQRRRAQIGLFMVVILNLGVYIWSIVMQTRFNSNNPGKIDWEDALYARSFLPYFFVQTTGPLSQSYMYWLLSSFATDAQGKRSPPTRLIVCADSTQQTSATAPHSAVSKPSARPSRTA